VAANLERDRTGRNNTRITGTIPQLDEAFLVRKDGKQADFIRLQHAPGFK
jgi:hypothetical protein